jgi:hypothetical protein
MASYWCTNTNLSMVELKKHVNKNINKPSSSLQIHQWIVTFRHIFTTDFAADQKSIIVQKGQN